MDTSKGQDNEVVAKVCRENNCNFIIVSHDLTNKFQPLDITFNKVAKSFIKEKYSTWYTEQETKLNSSQVKPRQAK